MRSSTASKIIALALLATGCATRPPVAAPPFAGQYRNACLPEAIAMVEGLREYGLPARVLLYAGPEAAHAIAVYEYDGQRWGWDSYWKSNRIRVPDLLEPDKCARAWLWATQSNTTISEALFL